MNEIHTYLWYKTNFLNRIGLIKNNPKLLGKSEDNILRDDLGLSLIEIATNNLKNYEDIKIFELGTVIKNDLNYERLTFIFNSSHLVNLFSIIESIEGWPVSITLLDFSIISILLCNSSIAFSVLPAFNSAIVPI